jgi:conjugal transfer pilus assembly protein TraI
MLSFFRKAMQPDKQGPQPGAGLPSTRPTELAREDDEIPRYPPFMKGLPATHPDKLIETQGELIGQIREAGLASPEIFEQFYRQSLCRFASYAHLLPASQTHHHRGAGGLLRHAAEVALWSLQSGDRVLLPGEQAPRRRRELQPRWHLAVFLAALCHDVGKPVTDLVVTSRDGAQVWNPFVEDLYSWAGRHQVDRYFLHWRENRGKKHQAISALIAERIISPQGLAWIAAGDTELVLWMMETINGSPSAENPIHDLVIRADQVSVERDLRSLGVAFTGYEIGLPVERFLVDIMRRLVREGTWGVNQPGARLWHIDGHLYLIWPAAGEEIAALIHQEKVPGLPRTPNSLLDMLVERQLASVREDRADGHRYWVIAPAVLAEKIPNIRLTAIRLREVALLIEPAPPSVPGRLLDQDETVTEPAGLPAPKLSPALKPRASPEQGRLPETPAQPEPPPNPPAAPTDQLDGAVGEALQALARDIQTGKKSAETLIHIDASGVLCLKWPDALSGCGLDSKAILDELSHRNWLAVDPLSPFRKVTEIDVGHGQLWKVIRLQSVIKQLMALGKPQQEQSSVAPPAVVSVEKSKPIPGRTETSGEDERLNLIQGIVATLREGVSAGVLPSEREGAFAWIPSRQAEPLLVDRLQLARMQILRLGSVVPDVFLCQTRNRAHCYRIPFQSAGDGSLNRSA